ncbi:BCAS2 family protein [Diplocarpon rosae]|nr:BCAS2 family protein [Diplocarpon rosae]
MPLTNAIHESLPYIDAEPTPSERAAALSLIALEASHPTTTAPEHPLLPPLAPEKFTPLMALERELEARKGEIDGVVIERKNAQEAVKGELKGLDEGWRRGVGRVLETEVAAEAVRKDILERRRECAR